MDAPLAAKKSVLQILEPEVFPQVIYNLPDLVTQSPYYTVQLSPVTDLLTSIGPFVLDLDAFLSLPLSLFFFGRGVRGEKE